MYAKKKSMSMKVVVLLLAVVLLIGCVAGGTLAWLITSTGPVENTFVAGNIGTLTLNETDGEGNAVTTRSFTVTPGVDIKKDPTVTFNGNNVAAYVFLKVEATGWDVSGSDTTYTYSIGTNQEMKWVLDGWTKLEDGVYYKEVAANAGEQSWSVIKDNKITVSSEITKANISDYTKGLTFTAYSIQQEGHAGDTDAARAAAAWTALQPSNT